MQKHNYVGLNREIKGKFYIHLKMSFKGDEYSSTNTINVLQVPEITPRRRSAQGFHEVVAE